MTARSTGKKVEVLRERTDVTQVFANPDGSLTMTSSARPQRVKRADGTWAAIDTALAPSGAGIRPAATTVDLTFSAGGTGPLVSVASGGTKLEVQPPAVFGSLRPPALDGDTATYPQVLPGVDLQLTADGQGFSEVLVVKDSTAAADDRLTKITFPVAVTGGDLSADADGNLQVMSKSSKPVFVGAAPSMWDSSTSRPGTPGQGRRASLATKVTPQAISVTPDSALLNDRAAVYPLYIDPGVTVTTAAWSLLESADPTTAYYNTAAAATIGTYNSGAAKFRSVFAMASQPLNGTHILAAAFRIRETGAWDCDSMPFELWSTSAISAATTWNNPPTWASLLGTQSSGAGGDACPAADVSFPVTSTVQAAADAGAANTWLGIRVNSAHEADSEYYKQFANNPVLDVTYNTKPAVPSGMTLSNCYLSCAAPWKVSASTPQFSAIVTDGDSGQRVQAEFQVRQGATVITGALSNSGTSGAWVYWTPTAALINGQTYTVRVRGYDGVDYSAWSADTAFSVDTTAPAAATVSSTTYPAGAWAGGADQAGSFTFGTNSDFAGFVYGLDENPPITAVPASSGAATVSLTPEVDGPHTLYVRSRDAAGNFGPVTSYAFNAGQAALILPGKGQLVISTTGVQAVAPAAATGYTLQWRRADTDTWTSVPTSDVTLAVGGGAVTWPQARVSGTFPKLAWNVAKTFNDAEAGTVAIDGPIQARVLAAGSGAVSTPLRFTLDQSAEQAGTADAGPGSVNLVTGNLEVDSTDANVSSYGSDLSIARTFNTRSAAAADPSGMFGTGWISTAGVQQEQSDYTGLTVTGSVVQVGTADGSSIGFTAKSGGGFSPALGYEDLALTHPDAATYQLAGLDGNVTTFTVPSGSALFKPTAIDTPGSAQTTTTSWETVTIGAATVTRPTRILAPVPAGVSCGAGTAGLVKGCRALSLTYATTTTATAGTPGDYAGRASQISFIAWDPDLATPAMRTVAVAKYAYDSTGRMVSQWDPRLDHDGGQHLAVTYAYDSSGILTTITPAAEQPWQLSYTTIPGDAGTGRLKQVSRSALTAGTATTTVVYQVPVAGSGAPYDLSATQTSRWGQADAPVQATAVFGPDQVPDGSQSAGTMPSSWTRAHLTYMDTSGQVVNTVEPGGATTAGWYDATGNVVRSLSATNRDRALNASTTDTAADEAALAGRYSTTNRYEAAGRRLKEIFGPEHDTAVPNGSGGWAEQRARTHTVLSYDESAPVGGPYDLVTTKITGARLGDGTDVDTRTSTVGYNWTLRVPTSVTTDPAGLNLTTRIAYDTTTGLPTSTTAPAGGTTTNTPRTTQAIYYSTAANSTYPVCGNHAEWANLVCLLRAGGAPSAGAVIPDQVTTYDMYHQGKVLTEQTPSATVLRTTTNTFDAAGRTLTVAKTASTGTALATTKNIYDATTGQLTQTQSLSGATVTAQIGRTYDTLGRITGYVDADNTSTTTTYDLLSRPATVNDGKATQTLTYDNRGQLAQVADTQAGTFTASYDADGNITSKGLPDTLSVTTGYNETGTATTRSTSAPGCTPTTNCIDVDEQVSLTAHNQWATHSTDFSGQQYTYDQAGRLTRAQDYIEPIFGYAGCATRVYGLDAASNRTSYQSYAPAAGGGCQTSTASVSRTMTYDTADRAATSGYVYDTLGRTTTIPSIDTENQTGNVTAAYYVNDLIRSLTQAGATTTYTLDVVPDRIRSWADATTTSTDHYSDDSDSPSWTASGTTYTRYISGPDSLLDMTYDSGTGELATRLGDLHGNIIGIITGTTTPEIQATYETDEYGVPHDPGDIGDVRYGYLGQHQRATDNPAGISLMGARLYNAATGRFLTVDPVQGASANPYDYCYAEPVNCKDLDGRNPAVAIVAAMGLGLTLPEVLAVVGAAFVATVVVYAVWHGTRAAADKLRTMYNKQTKKSGKEKASDTPSWSKGERMEPEDGTKKDRFDKATRRIFSKHHKRQNSAEYSKIRKALVRNGHT